MSTDSKNGIDSVTRSQFNRIGLWQLANTIRQNLGVSRAAVESHFGDTVKDFSFLDELPLGSTTNITVTDGASNVEKKSPLKTVALAATIAAASGALGFLANDYFSSPPEPVPVDTVLEWEVPVVGGGNTTEDIRTRAEGNIKTSEEAGSSTSGK